MVEVFQIVYNKSFTEEIVQYLIFNEAIVSSVEYLQKMAILHLDLKLDNILINFEDEKEKKK